MAYEKGKLSDYQLQTIMADILPHDDDRVNLGSSGKEFKNLYIDGMAYIDHVDATVFETDTLKLMNTKTKTSAYTATIYDNVILCQSAGGAFTITLPAAASSAGLVLIFKKTDAAGNAVTLDGNAAELIDGAQTNAEMDAQYDTMTILCDGTGWHIIAKMIA